MRGKFRLWFGWYGGSRGEIFKNMGDLHFCSMECLNKYVDYAERRGDAGGKHRIEETPDGEWSPEACDECK